MSTVSLPPHEKKLRVLTIALSVLLLALEFFVFVKNMPLAIGGRAIFRSFYDDAVGLRTGHLFGNASITFSHAIYEAILFVPLSYLGYRAAYLVFLIVNLALLASGVAMMWPYLLRLNRVWSLLPVALFVCFFPVVMTLVEGGDSILLMTLLIASAVSFYREKELASGMLLGLGLFDFQYAIPIAILFLVWRKWRIAGGFAISAVVLFLLTAWLTHSTSLHDLIHSRLEPLHASVFPFELPNLRWLIQTPTSGVLSTNLLIGLTLAASAVLLGWAATRPPNFALASAVALIVSYRGSAQDLVLLVLPMSFILLSRVAQVSPREMFSKYIMGAMFLAPAFLMLSPSANYGVGILLLLLLIPLRSLF